MKAGSSVCGLSFFDLIRDKLCAGESESTPTEDLPPWLLVLPAPPESRQIGGEAGAELQGPGGSGYSTGRLRPLPKRPTELPPHMTTEALLAANSPLSALLPAFSTGPSIPGETGPRGQLRIRIMSVRVTGSAAKHLQAANLITQIQIADKIKESNPRLLSLNDCEFHEEWSFDVDHEAVSFVFVRVFSAQSGGSRLGTAVVAVFGKLVKDEWADAEIALKLTAAVPSCDCTAMLRIEYRPPARPSPAPQQASEPLPDSSPLAASVLISPSPASFSGGGAGGAPAAAPRPELAALAVPPREAPLPSIASLIPTIPATTPRSRSSFPSEGSPAAAPAPSPPEG
eukprot:tig00000498_g1610.t1